MTHALASPSEVSAAAHIPDFDNGNRAVTALRVHGFEPSVTARCTRLPEQLRAHGTLRRISDEEAQTFWQTVCHVKPLDDGRPLWRVHVPPSASCSVVSTLEPLGARWLWDWAGGLIWLSIDSHADTVRQAAAKAGGHATLVRAPEGLRAQIPMQHPRSPGVMALEARVRRAFDPAGVFETGRFLD
jgi:glycolate oxidase FAD binding subunit